MNEQDRNTLSEALLRVSLGEQDWRVRSVEVHEELDCPYQLVLDLIGQEDDVEVSVDELLGREVVLFIERGDDERVVPGIIRKASILGVRSRKQHAKVWAVPAVGLLEERRRSRIFQDMTVVQVVEEVVGDVFRAFGRDLEVTKLKGVYPVRDHLAQYRESDLQFLQRILQHEGIAFRFEVVNDRELMVLVDDATGFRELERTVGDQQLMLARHDPAAMDEETIHHFEWTRCVRPGRVRTGQWTWKDDPRMLSDEADFRDDNRGADLEDPADRQRAFFVEQWDDFPPPGRNAFEPEPDATSARARLTRQRHAAHADRGSGRGNAIGIAPGVTFELSEHPDPELDRVYVVTKVTHVADCPHADVHDVADDSAAEYIHYFEALPIDVQYRPANQIPKPHVRGPHIGVVTGNQEIHTDRHGRVRVRMSWDATVDERGDGTEPSCWIRVVSPWAGPDHGLQAVPRVGSEVVIDYIDGDIDRPVCMGCLFNGRNKDLVDLPEERTRFTLRTRSSPGGDGFNELTFEDAAGAEEVFVHAQRDMNTKVRRNQSTSVGNDQSNTVGHDQRVTVRNDRTLTVEGDERHAVTKDRMRRVEGTEEVIILGSRHVQVGGGPGTGSAVDPPEAGSREAVQGTKEIFARDKLVLQVGPSCSIVMTPMGIQIQAPTAVGVEVPSAALNLVPGLLTAKAAASELAIGPTARIKSDAQVRHECGSSHVTVEPMAVRTKALTTVVNGLGTTTIKGGATATISAGNIGLDAAAAVHISGTAVTAVADGVKQTMIGGTIDLD